MLTKIVSIMIWNQRFSQKELLNAISIENANKLRIPFTDCDLSETSVCQPYWRFSLFKQQSLTTQTQHTDILYMSVEKSPVKTIFQLQLQLNYNRQRTHIRWGRTESCKIIWAQAYKRIPGILCISIHIS